MFEFNPTALIETAAPKMPYAALLLFIVFNPLFVEIETQIKEISRQHREGFFNPPHQNDKETQSIDIPPQDEVKI